MIFTAEDMPIVLEVFDPDSRKFVFKTFHSLDEWIEYNKKLRSYINLYGCGVSL